MPRLGQGSATSSRGVRSPSDRWPSDAVYRTTYLIGGVSSQGLSDQQECPQLVRCPTSRYVLFMGWLTTSVILAVCVCLLPFALLYARRRWLTRQGGLFDCAHRMRDAGPGVGWVLGFARYRDNRLDWYRAFSLALRPSRSFSRATTVWQRRRPATALEAVVLFDESHIVTISDRFTGHEHNLAMSLDNVMALMAWLESAPPGSHYPPRSAGSP